jgi:hypothetical protein
VLPLITNVSLTKVTPGGYQEHREAHNLVVDSGLNWIASLSGNATVGSGQGFNRTVVGSSPQAPSSADTDCIVPMQTVTNVMSKPSATQSAFSSSHTGLSGTVRESVLMWTPVNLALARVTFSSVTMEPQDVLYVRWTTSFA